MISSINSTTKTKVHSHKEIEKTSNLKPIVAQNGKCFKSVFKKVNQ